MIVYIVTRGTPSDEIHGHYALLTKEYEMKFDFGKISERVHSWMGWGGMAMGGYHLLNSLTGREPPDSAGNLAKLAHGGLFSSDDERAMDEIELELKTDEERELLTGFRTWIRTTYGPGLVGSTLNWLYANRFRSVVVRMRTPEKTKVVSVVTKDAKGKDVVTKSDELVAAVNTKAVDFLSRLAGEIKKGMDETKGSANKKAEVGYRRACAFLQDKSFPVPSFIDRIQSVDAALKGAPVRGAHGASVAAKAATTFTGEAIEEVKGYLAQNKLETETYEASLPWFRRMMRF